MHDTMLGRRLLETAGPGRWVPAVTFLAGMVFLVGTALAEVAAGQQATEVKVERVRPEKQSYATLRFLKENRGFIRARFDLLREKPVGRNGGAGEIDPGLLAYSKMLAEVMAAEDSVGAAHNAYRQRLQQFSKFGIVVRGPVRRGYQGFYHCRCGKWCAP